MQDKKAGFTLVELLVVIAIIAVITSIAVTNFLGARERARDAKKKAEMAQLKNALRLYFNDYGLYPSNSGTQIQGCGTTAAPTTCSWGGTFSKDGTTYMRALPTYPTGTTYSYAQLLTGDDFLLSVTIDNASDADATTSQTKCGIGSPAAKTFTLCAD